MKQKQPDFSCVNDFRAHLINEERSAATVEKYLRDVCRFFLYAKGKRLDKTLVLQYKSDLSRDYTVTSVNSMLAALNAFFRYVERTDLCVKQLRVQRDAYCSEEKELTREEYRRLLRAAAETRGDRLSLLLETICGTGIRVSELKYITVEAVKKGEAVVNCKGKNRRIFLVTALRKKLLRYIEKTGRTTGSIFLGRGGKPVD